MLIFNKSELLAAVRQVLWGAAAWNNYLFDEGAAERLLELEREAIPDPDDLDGAVDWTRPGCLGPLLENAQVLRHLSHMYDFVTTGEWYGDEGDLEDARHELTPIDLVLHPHSVLDSPSGQELVSESARSKVREVMEHMTVRCQLHGGQLLELRQVALLAGLAEKTVRMAAMRTGKGPELNTIRQDNRTWVEATEALRWLSTKRNFRPTRFCGRDVAPGIEPKDLPQLQWALRSLRERAGLSVEEFGKRLKWRVEVIGAYASLESGAEEIDAAEFPAPTFVAIAKVLAVNEPKAFARAAARALAHHTIDQALASADLDCAHSDERDRRFR